MSIAKLVQDCRVDLDPQTLPDSMREVADACSIGDAINLMCHLPGLHLVVPASGKRSIVRYEIAQNYTGQNSSALAVRLKVDRSRVVAIAKEIEKKQLKPIVEMPNTHMRMVDEKCGREVALRLMMAFPDRRIYVPRKGLNELKRCLIRQLWDGTNAIQLAVDLEVSEVWVRKIVRSMYERTSHEQLDLFGS